MSEAQEAQREMTVDEWCGQLPDSHLVNKQFKALAELAEATRWLAKTHFGDIDRPADQGAVRARFFQALDAWEKISDSATAQEGAQNE